MKSGISKIMAVLATMLAFSSCEKERELLSFGSDDRAIRIIPEIASPYTKSNPITDGKETEFNKGDMIALLCNDGHVTYKLTDKGWQTTDNYYLRWGSAPVSYSAFYPATEKSTTFGNFELQSSQRTADRLAAADYMTCTVEDAVKTSTEAFVCKWKDRWPRSASHCPESKAAPVYRGSACGLLQDLPKDSRTRTGCT